MQMSYLSKLKEQEVIRNYIEVLTNQIKELSFVQNGVITFDALKSNVKYNNKKILTSTTTSTGPGTTGAGGIQHHHHHHQLQVQNQGMIN